MLLKLTSNSWSPPQFPSSWNYRHAPPCLFCLYKSAPLKWHIGMEPGSICPSWLAHSPGDTGSSVFFPYAAHPRMPSLLTVSNIPLSKCACHTYTLIYWWICSAFSFCVVGMKIIARMSFHVSVLNLWGQYLEVKLVCVVLTYQNLLMHCKIHYSAKDSG